MYPLKNPYLVGDLEIIQAAAADDGILHELAHLAASMQICTHCSMDALAARVGNLQAAFSASGHVTGQTVEAYRA